MVHILEKVKPAFTPRRLVTGLGAGTVAGVLVFGAFRIGNSQPVEPSTSEVAACARGLGEVAVDVSLPEVPPKCTRFILARAVDPSSHEAIVHLPSAVEFRQDPPDKVQVPGSLSSGELGLISGAAIGFVAACITSGHRESASTTGGLARTQ